MGLEIPYFAGHQDDVFLLSLVAAAVATIGICLPIILAPMLKRRRIMKPTVLGLGAVSVVAVGIFAWQAVINIGVLVNERSEVQLQIARAYGVRVSITQVDELINGGRPRVSLPRRAADLGIASSCLTLRLVPEQSLISHAQVPSIDYGLELGGVPLRGTTSSQEEAVPCLKAMSGGSA